MDSNPPAAPLPAEDSDVDTVVLDNADALEYDNPTHLVAIEMAGYLMDPTDMVGPDNPYAETLRCTKCLFNGSERLPQRILLVISKISNFQRTKKLNVLKI